MASVAVVRHQLFKPSEPFVWSQSQHFKEYDATFIGKRPQYATPDGLRDEYFIDGTTDDILYSVLGRTGALEKKIRDCQGAVVHAHFGAEGVYAAKAARRLDLPLVTTLHGYDVSMTGAALRRSKSPAWWRYSVLRETFLKEASSLVCVSKAVKSRAIALGAREGSCVIIPTGVDVSHLQPRPQPSRPRLVHVARLVEKKGTRYLIMAMNKVVKRFPEVRLSIIGDGPLRGEMQKLAKESNLGSHIDFLGFLPGKSTLDLIAESTALVLPSVTASTGDFEGLGQVILEAGALGKPVVATRHGGIEEAVEDGLTGLLVGERDFSGLAHAICDLLANASLAQELGQAGRRRVEKYFSIQESASKLEEVYRAGVSS